MPNRWEARSDSAGLTGAFCLLSAITRAARGRKQVHGLPAGTKGEAICQSSILPGCPSPLPLDEAAICLQ